MISNNLKTAWRNIKKKKIHAVINIIGLVSSMAFVLLIAAYIWHTHQVNSDLRNKDQQYVLQSEYKKSGIGLELTTIGALPKALREEYPHLVANYYRMDGLTCIISNGTEAYEESVSLGDPTLLDKWLTNYAARTELHIGVFVLPVIGLTLLLLFIIGSIVFRTARANPVESLRDE